MEKKRVRALAGLLVQLIPGQEYSIIMDAGVMYYPAPAVEFLDDEENGEEAPAKPSKAAKPKAAAKEEKAAPAPKKAAAPVKEEGGKYDEIHEVLSSLDAGDLDVKKAVASLVKVTGLEAAAIKPLVQQFNDNEDEEIDDVTQQINDLVDGEDEPEEKPAPSKKAATKAAPKAAPAAKDKKPAGEEVEPGDLEVDDEVAVYWTKDDDETYNKWFHGKVTAVKRGGKVIIAYEDDTEEAYTPGVNTTIIRKA